MNLVKKYFYKWVLDLDSLGIDRENYRFFLITHFITILAIVGHASFATIYSYTDILPAIINLISILLYITANILNRKKYHKESYFIIVFVVIIFTFINDLIFTNYHAFPAYILCLVPYTFSSNFIVTNIKILIAILFGFMYLYIFSIAYSLSLTSIVYELFNLPFFIMSLSFPVYYYQKGTIKVEKQLTDYLIREKEIEKDKLIAEKKLIEKEMLIAKKIQNIILPKNFKCDDLDIEKVMIPADEVAGDYYDLQFDKDNNVWIAIGDVCGHGVTSGIIMMMVQTAFKTIIALENLKPSEAVSKLNQVIYDNISNRLNQEKFMTFLTFKYIKNGDFTYSGLHGDFFIYRKQTGTIEIVESEGAFLNIVPDISTISTDLSIHLNDEDMIILFTDGLYEAVNREEGLLGLDALKTLVLHSVKKWELGYYILSELIIEDILRYSNYKNTDDMALVIIRKK